MRGALKGTPAKRVVTERAIVFLIGAVQFVNILDFVMVTPLGPFYTRALGIPESQMGFITGSYTAAASIAGFLGSFVLDRFDRRRALAVAMFGLVFGTLACSFATGLSSLMAARALAGFFGGPATSISMSIIADVIPVERRGKALGAVAGAFSVASVLGVFLGLTLAERGGWRMPFFSVALLGFAVAAGAIFYLPAMRGHLTVRGEMPSLGALLSRRTVQWSYLMTATVMIGGFMVIPNIPVYVVGNLGYPQIRVKWLYSVGGAVSFFSMRLVGRLVDRFGSFPIAAFGSALVCVALYIGFVRYDGFPIMALFVLFMIAMSFRNVAYNTLTSKVPRPAERARFMSLQSSIQHLAMSVGAFIGSQMLRSLPNHQLVGMARVAGASMALTALLPLLVRAVEQRVRAAAAP